MIVFLDALLSRHHSPATLEQERHDERMRKANLAAVDDAVAYALDNRQRRSVLGIGEQAHE